VTYYCPATVPWPTVDPQVVSIVPQAGQVGTILANRTVWPSTPVSGTFALSIRGQRTSQISFAASSGTVQQAIEGVLGQNSNEVYGSTTGLQDGGTWNVTLWAHDGACPCPS